MINVLVIVGTRPEAIKMAPVIRALRLDPRFSATVCSTGQHREMLKQVLDVFGISVDRELSLMTPGQSLPDLTADVVRGLDSIIGETDPQWVLVQGDTTTAFCGALAAFYRKVRVAHVEAGLRTGDMMSPWPEEMNRRLISGLASHHFAPTERSAANLVREGHDPETVTVTGNTVVDALRHVSTGLSDGALSVVRPYTAPTPGSRLILVTGHRRENFSEGLGNMCEALKILAGRGDVEIVYPVHMNPNVQTIVRAQLADIPHIQLISPLAYTEFIQAMMDSYFIVSDSGGVQEEAPALGRPVLVTRDTTERPEAIEAGTAILVGRETDALVSWAATLLDNPKTYNAMAKTANPFGDGTASVQILDRLARI
ncbi:non-hydrolyzing UDP-N-acetylglucosamine 2-epimerase [Brevundimonas sp. NPDC092305]|uniref:non-hydrolyzing UDP-N-acetylglucosamine 2-epimerase n=1 Tax=Brevundimonas sp. NPDC092305 TaxID=3363957 RepID=UPI00381AC1D0